MARVLCDFRGNSTTLSEFIVYIVLTDFRQIFSQKTPGIMINESVSGNFDI